MKKNNNRIYRIYYSLISISIILGLTMLFSCKPEDENPITITSLVVSNDSPESGETITVTINAEDEDERELSYDFWAKDANDQDISTFGIITPSENTANWTAPLTGGDYTIYGKAYADDDSDTDSKDIVVLDSSQPVVLIVYPSDGGAVEVFNHPQFTFTAYHSNGIKTSEGDYLIEFKEGDNPIDVTNIDFESSDNKNYTCTFDADLDGTSGNCSISVQVESTLNAKSEITTVNFTVEGASQDY